MHPVPKRKRGIPPSPPPPSGVIAPVGAFPSSGSTTVINHAQARGLLVREDWATLEATSTSGFNFSSIDSAAAPAIAAGKPWSLAIIAGGIGSPAWLIDVLGAPFIDYTFRGMPERLPIWWNSIVKTRLQQLATALGNEYNNSLLLKLVYVPQMASNGIEGHLQGVNMTTFKASPHFWTQALWITASKDTAVAFANAFPAKSIAIEVHEVDNTHIPSQTIITDLHNDASLGQRVGAGMWWISGKTTYQPDLIDVLDVYPGKIYAQIIGKSNEGSWAANAAYVVGDEVMSVPQNRFQYTVQSGTGASPFNSGAAQPNWPLVIGNTVVDNEITWVCTESRFLDGDYQTPFNQARALGCKYIEPWEWEFKSPPNGTQPQWTTGLKFFNEYADGNGNPQTEIIGQSQTDQWFQLGGTFVVPRWQARIKYGSGMSDWKSPTSTIWTAPEYLLTSDGTPLRAYADIRRVIVTVGRATPATAAQYQLEMEEMIVTVRSKYVNAEEIIFQPLAAGPNRTMCQAEAPPINVLTCVNLPAIETAIWHVDANNADVRRGLIPLVTACSSFVDEPGHLNTAGQQDIAAKVTKYYA